MSAIPSLKERIARYERMAAAREAGSTLAEIGAAEDPPIGKERVRQILAKRPEPVGRPRSADKLSAKLEAARRRARRRTELLGADDPKAIAAHAQVAALEAELDRIEP